MYQSDFLAKEKAWKKNKKWRSERTDDEPRNIEKQEEEE